MSLDAFVDVTHNRCNRYRSNRRRVKIEMLKAASFLSIRNSVVLAYYRRQCELLTELSIHVHQSGRRSRKTTNIRLRSQAPVKAIELVCGTMKYSAHMNHITVGEPYIDFPLKVALKQSAALCSTYINQHSIFQPAHQVRTVNEMRV